MPMVYDKRSLNHERALAWVKQQMIAMGFAFNETHMEAGIDAFVELADPTSGEAKGKFFGVQVKTCGNFDAETPVSFSFYTDKRHIGYWMASNIPVLLIVCRAQTEEAYAVWVRRYFSLPENRESSTVHLSKTADRFLKGEDWQRRLLDEAVPHRFGFSFPPVPEEECISSNLLEVVLPKQLFRGKTNLKKRGDVFAELRKHPNAGREFILRDGFIWSVRDLRSPAWRDIVDSGTLTDEAFADLAFHVDPAKCHYAKELLHNCLTERLRHEDVHWVDMEEMYVYAPSRAVQKRVRKLVNTGKTHAKRGLIFPSWYQGRITRYRHLAMMAHFVRIDADYYLQVDPTYYFSTDGHRKHPRADELIRAARILQKQRDYFTNLQTWRALLTASLDLGRSEYPFVSFGEYRQFTCPVSISDRSWKAPGLADGVNEEGVDQTLALEFP